MRKSVMIGADRAIVRLETGEYVCIDANSIDSIPYLLGHELEADVVPIFRTFLTPSSTVLDIGANYGFYTAITASVVKDQGRLYSFEGNPHTFQTLQRTLFANSWHLKPNLITANVLVSDKSGRGVLYYTTEALSGATMSDIDLWGGERRSVEVDITTIDGFLPSDLFVDLAKIDVEGHEPLVIRGMEKTIARSPNIRLIIEFWDALLDYTTGARNFVSYIHDLGFAMCRILPQGRLAQISTVEVPNGFNHFLLTHTPKEDMALARRQSRRPAVRFKRWLNRWSLYLERRQRAWHRL